MTVTKEYLKKFLKESNAIEGIHKEATKEQLKSAKEFLLLPDLTVADVENIVKVFQPNAELRNRPGLDVYVGNHVPLAGGPAVEKELHAFLSFINLPRPNYRRLPNLTMECHQDYEILHPFTDGNGRSGRLIWLWQMNREGNNFESGSIGFLHCYYYQTLDAVSKKVGK